MECIRPLRHSGGHGYYFYQDIFFLQAAMFLLVGFI
jgi:uncharacterized membrane protein